MIAQRDLRLAVAILLFAAALIPVATAADTTYVRISAGGKSAGVDSFYVFHQVVLGYVVSSTGSRIHEIDFPAQFTFTNGNLVGPVVTPAGFSFNPPAISQFSLLQFDSTYGAEATDPDTLYWHASGGTGYGGTLAYLRFTPQDTGTIAVDSVRLPSGVGLSARDSNGVEQALAWTPRTIRIVPGELRFRIHAHTISAPVTETLRMGVLSRITFILESTGATVGRIDWPSEYQFSNGNIIGPLAEGVSAVPGADAGLFDSVLWSGEHENATDPDTTWFRLASSGGVLLNGTYELWHLDFTPADTGIIILDSLTLPPGIKLSVADPAGAPLSVVWAPDTVWVAADFPSIRITTQLGNDTMYANTEGSVVFHLHAAGWNVSAIVWPLEFDFGGAGNLIGPVGVDHVDSARFIYSDYTKSVMESNPFNSSLGLDFTDDPDTLLFGSIDFNGGGWNIDGEYARITFTPSSAGTIAIDGAFVPPSSAGTVSLLDQSAGDLYYTWSHPSVITILPCPVMMGDVNNDLVINTADLIYMVNYIFKSGPDPLPMRTVGDANCSGGLGGSDIIYLVNYIFKGGQPPCACYKRII